jgi:hypothetical protein
MNGKITFKKRRRPNKWLLITRNNRQKLANELSLFVCPVLVA